LGCFFNLKPRREKNLAGKGREYLRFHVHLRTYNERRPRGQGRRENPEGGSRLEVRRMDECRERMTLFGKGRSYVQVDTGQYGRRQGVEEKEEKSLPGMSGKGSRLLQL